MDYEVLSKNENLQIMIQELSRIVRKTHPDQLTKSVMFLLLCNDIHVFCNKNGFLVNIHINTNPPHNDSVKISLDVTKTDAFDGIFTDAGIFLKMHNIPNSPN